MERHFISAGFGLVGESEKIPPYEMTFSGMRMNKVRQRSSRLNIKPDLERLLRKSNPDIVFFALGKKYYASIDIDELVQELKPNQIGVVFNRELADDQFENIVSVPARLEDAKRHGTIVIGLKGLYLENFAKYLSEVEAVDTELIDKLCRHIEEEPMQAGIGNF
ncbi:hypothetical protein K933_17292 [Candidatus Halobonum tyrrellensis G22]|uniref:Uncharacterized protein n=1 Tax=Candidatus Halobonum tyrrellensis G22 TaxID=1324957 RepID=V4H857_9EURY|nr:hypothetical protein K933_17292 [Candidatus Halobonum tyrrellensis G22]